MQNLRSHLLDIIRDQNSSNLWIFMCAVNLLILKKIFWQIRHLKAGLPCPGVGPGRESPIMAIFGGRPKVLRINDEFSNNEHLMARF